MRKTGSLLVLASAIFLASAGWRPVRAAAPDDGPLNWAEPGLKETTALLDIMKAGDTERLDALLEDDIDIEQDFVHNQERLPLLSLAMVAKSIDAAKYLIDAGADIEQMSRTINDDWGPVGLSGVFKWTAPHYRELSEGGSDMLEIYTPLMSALWFDFPEGAELLIERGADIFVTGAGETTALIVAAAGNHLGVVQTLLAREATADDQLEDDLTLKFTSKAYAPGATALWYAAGHGNEEMVKLLLRAGADGELMGYCAHTPQALTDEEYCTASRIAELKGHPEVAEMIRSGEFYGEDAVLTDKMNLTIETDTVEQREDLLNRLEQIARDDDVEGLREYLEAGLDVDMRLGKYQDTTLLSVAARAKAATLLRLIIREGADVDLMTMTNTGQAEEYTSQMGPHRDSKVEQVPKRTPLMDAVISGCEECFSILLAEKADVNAVGYQGYTALAYACRNDRTDMARRLIEAGADVNPHLRIEEGSRVPHADGATPLWIAASLGKNDLVRMLSESGADLYADAFCAGEDGAGEGERTCSPRRIAELRRNTSTVELISRLTAKE